MINMKVRLIRGGSLDDLEAKKYNISIGISIGNKFYSKENLNEYLKIALTFTKERVGFLIADSLHSINYVVKDDMSLIRAKKKAIRKGDEVMVLIKELIDELPLEERNKIDIIRWDDILSQKNYSKYISYLNFFYNTNDYFKKRINLIIIKYLGDKVKKINEASTYLIEELPELLLGFNYNNIHYDSYFSPEDDLITKLVDDINNKKEFSELRESIHIDPKVFIQVN